MYMRVVTYFQRGGGLPHIGVYVKTAIDRCDEDLL